MAFVYNFPIQSLLTAQETSFDNITTKGGEKQEEIDLDLNLDHTASKQTNP